MKNKQTICDVARGIKDKKPNTNESREAKKRDKLKRKLVKAHNKYILKEYRYTRKALNFIIKRCKKRAASGYNSLPVYTFESKYLKGLQDFEPLIKELRGLGFKVDYNEISALYIQWD